MRRNIFILQSALFLLSIVLWSSCGNKSKVEVPEIDSTYVEENEEISLEETKSDYIDLGSIDVYEWIQNEDGIGDSLIKGYNLFVRVINQDNFYYISNGGEMFPVSKEGVHEGCDWWNGKASNGLYLDISAWPANKCEPVGVSEKENNYNTNEVQKVVVEQVRSPQPMQVWIPCGACNNSGQCQTCYGQGWTYSSSDRYYDGKAPCSFCGGSGKCHFCAGQGGHNEIQYR